MLTIRIRRHGRHEMPHTPPLPERFRRLLRWQEARERGEWVNPEVEDWYRALQREYHRWLIESRLG